LEYFYECDKHRSYERLTLTELYVKKEFLNYSKNIMYISLAVSALVDLFILHDIYNYQDGVLFVFWAVVCFIWGKAIDSREECISKVIKHNLDKSNLEK
jgi:hypothetical protein